MTIRRKLILLPIIALLMLFGVGALTACSSDALSESDVIDMGYEVAVVFDFTGGSANGAATTKIRVQPDSYIPEPGQYGLASPIRTSYSLKCYRVAELDESGNVVTDGNGNPVLGREWDFFVDKATENTVLYAEWWENYKMLMHYGESFEYEKEVDIPRTRDGEPTSVTEAASRVTGFTFIGYYLDENKTEPVAFPNTFEFDDGEKTVEVWGESLEGTYQLIRTAADFSGFSFASGTNIYIMDDIDMNDLYAEGKTVTFPASYSGKFMGNGYTISNLVVERTPSGASDYNFGMFKSLEAKAVISNVTFENVKFVAKLTNSVISEYNVGLLAGIIRAGANISGVTVSGTIDYTLVAGYDVEKVTVDKLAGNVSSDAAIENCTYSDITIIGSMPIYTADKTYAIYAKYTDNGDGTVTLGDVYGIAKQSGTKYSARTLLATDGVVKNADGSWTLKERTITYTVTISDNGAGGYTATVVQQ